MKKDRTELYAGLGLVVFVAFLLVREFDASGAARSADRRANDLVGKGDLHEAAIVAASCLAVDGGEVEPNAHFECVARLADIETGSGHGLAARARLDVALSEAERAGPLVTVGTRTDLLLESSLVSGFLGDFPRAVADARAALGLGPTGERLAEAHLRLGNALPHGEEAEEHLREARAGYLALPDPGGTGLGNATLSLGRALVKSRPDEAMALFEEAMVAYDSTVDGGHPFAAVALAELGSMWGGRGDVDGGLTALLQATTRLRAGFGDDSPHLATSLCSMADVLVAAGREAEALAAYQQGILIAERTGSREDVCCYHFAQASARAGQAERGRRVLQSLVTIVERDAPTDSRDRELDSIREWLATFDSEDAGAD